MTKEWEEYVGDPRSICKYGIKCYQKNPEHHAKYKHPPAPRTLKKKRENRDKHRFSPYRRDKPSPRANANAESNRDNGPATSTDNVFPNITDNELASNTNIESETKDNETEIYNNNKLDDSELASTYNDNEPATCSKNTETKNYVGSPEKLKVGFTEKLLYFDAKKHDMLEDLFLTKMPEDFFKFYECLNIDNEIEKTLSSVNLQLIGPYELLCGKLPIVEDKELYLVHWRFFYDPPEFQKGMSEYHIGYFRDVPSERPVFLASNDSSKDYHIKPMAENIFGAVYIYLQNEKKSSPFTSVACQKLMEKLKRFAEENSFSLEEYNMKKRQAKIVTKSFHGAGIVVPYNKKTQLGYRHLVENDVTIKKLFTKLQAAKSQKEKDDVLSELQPVITYASIALDECDFGTGVEVGIALFCSGLKELEPSALSSLTAAYKLLNREGFSKIIEAHLKFRRKGPNMSLLALSDK